MTEVQRIQHHRITFDIVTRASEPLGISNHEKEHLRQAMEQAARDIINLSYYPESRHIEERHQWIGVDLPEAPDDRRTDS